MSTTVCIHTISMPTWGSLISGVTFPWPPTKPTLPPMPTLPNPIFPGMDHANYEMMCIIQELKQFSMLNLINVVISKFETLIGSIPLPHIPGTSYSLTHLLSTVHASDILAAIKTAIEDGVTAVTDLIPNPLLPGLKMPSIADIAAMKFVIRNYVMTLWNLIASKLHDVATALGLSFAGLSFPTIPSIADLEAYITSCHPFTPPHFAVSLPGFPSFTFPSPIIPGFKSGALEVKEHMVNLMDEMSAYIANMITDFITSPISHPGLGLSLTTSGICLTF